MDLTAELSEALDPNNGTDIEAFLPVLFKLVVISEGDLVHQPFGSFIHACNLTGLSIDLQVI